jgi:penicillin amidase
VEFSHWAEIDEFNQLVSILKTTSDYAPNMNVLYTTKDDHIGYQVIGRIPLRRNNTYGMYIKDGTVSKFDWIKLISKGHKLNLQDPPKGYIVTANNKAAGSDYFNGTADSAIYTARATRITQLIEKQIAEKRKFTLKDMK